MKSFFKSIEIFFYCSLPGNFKTLLYKNTHETHPSDRQSYTLERRYIIYSQSKRDSFKVTSIISRKSQGADCFIPSVITMLPVDSLSLELIPGDHDSSGNYLNRLICSLIRNWLHIHPSMHPYAYQYIHHSFCMSFLKISIQLRLTRQKWKKK